MDMHFSVIRKIFLIFFMVNAMASSAFAVRYAVISSGGQTTVDDQLYHSEYWYDLYQAYESMLNMGIPQENITVLYGEGADFVSAHPEFQNRWTNERPQITQFNNHKATLQQVLDDLANVVTARDTFLFQWAIGHGELPGNVDPTQYFFHIANEGTTVTHAEIAGYINQITNYSQRVILWGTCHSGAIRSALANNRTVVLTACALNQNHYSSSYCDNNTPHADFPYAIYSILAGNDLCGTGVDGDDNNNQWIDMNELFSHVQTQYATQNSQNNTVCIGDDGNMANQTWWLRPPWQHCLTFLNNGTPQTRIIGAGTAQIRGIEQSSSLSGMLFRKNDVSLMSVTTSGNLVRTSSNTNQSAWLNTSDLTGGLVFKNSNNVNVMYLSPTGETRNRGWYAPQYPPFN